MFRKLSLPIALAGGVLACGDAVVQPTEMNPDALNAAVVAAETWEVFTVATSVGTAIATGINNAGVIVGYINEESSRAFRYSSGTMTTYSPPEGFISAHGINKWGQIVGSINVNDTMRAYVRQANGDLDLLPYWGPPGTQNFGVAINDLGEVAGMTGRPEDPGGPGDNVGLRWSVAIGGWHLSFLGMLLDKPVQFVHDINNSGWIVGAVAENVGFTGGEAFVHKPGQSIQLIGSLGGRSSALSINNSGKVLGSSELMSGEPRVFSWTSFGGMKNEVAVSDWGSFFAISDKGRIAAYSRIKGLPRAFTVHKGVHTVLPLLPNGRSSYVRDVNACGAIVGYIRMNDGSTRAVRWRRVVGSPPFAVCD